MPMPSREKTLEITDTLEEIAPGCGAMHNQFQNLSKISYVLYADVSVPTALRSVSYLRSQGYEVREVYNEDGTIMVYGELVCD